MKRFVIVFFVVFAVLLVAGRWYLPHALKRMANERLSKLPDYSGHLNQVSLSFFRGSITLQDLELERKDHDLFLKIPRVTVNLLWLPLLRRHVIADVNVEQPSLRVSGEKPGMALANVGRETAKMKKKIEKETGMSISDLLASALPFRVDQFTIQQGSLILHTEGRELRKENKTPALQGQITDIDLRVTNLTNSKKLSDTLNANVEAHASIMSRSPMHLSMKINPVATEAHFSYALTIKALPLEALNPVLDWQWGVRAGSGTFTVYSEAVAMNGGFKGYVKPLLKDLKVAKKHDRGPVQVIKEAVVSVVSTVFKNDDTDNVATQIPFEGKFDNPKAGLWEAVGELFSNAFIAALRPSFDPEFKPVTP